MSVSAENNPSRYSKLFAVIQLHHPSLHIRLGAAAVDDALHTLKPDENEIISSFDTLSQFNSWMKRSSM